MSTPGAMSEEARVGALLLAVVSFAGEHYLQIRALPGQLETWMVTVRLPSTGTNVGRAVATRGASLVEALERAWQRLYADLKARRDARTTPSRRRPRMGTLKVVVVLLALIGAPALAAAEGSYMFVPAASKAQAWETAGEKVNPAANTVLAETGPFAAGVQQRRVEIVNKSAALISVRFEWRTATGATKRVWHYLIPANTELPPKTPPAVQVADGERFRLILPHAVQGTVQGHLVQPVSPAVAQEGEYRFIPLPVKPQAWQTLGEKANPPAETILAETAAFAAAGVQERRAEVLNLSPAPISVRFEWRDASSVKQTWLFQAPAKGPGTLGGLRIAVAAGDHFRLVLVTAVPEGTVQGHLVGP